MTFESNNNDTSLGHNHPSSPQQQHQQIKIKHIPQQMEKIKTSISTIEQQYTENEVMPFFVNIDLLPKSQIQHLRTVGLLSIPLEQQQQQSSSSLIEVHHTVVEDDIKNKTDTSMDEGIIELDLTDPDATIDLTTTISSSSYVDTSTIEVLTSTMQESIVGNDDTKNDEQKEMMETDTSLYDICLVRNKHIEYIQQIWDIDNNYPPLKSSFTSLDASRPWMMYWCLHSYDLLDVKSNDDVGCNNSTNDSSTNSSNKYVLTQEQRELMVVTISKCFTKIYTPIQIPASIVKQDRYLTNLSSSVPASTDTSSNTFVEFTNVGGFGGNIDQLPHAATTYAAINALCILSKSTISAVQLLIKIKPLLYPWLISLLLPQNNGSFRMHHDGEIDVRASYCVMSVISLLGYYNNNNYPLSTTTKTSNGDDDTNDDKSEIKSIIFDNDTIVQYIAKCQTWEGGFSGEPFGEAHGGYTFCSIAAIQIWLLHQKINQTKNTTNNNSSKVQIQKLSSLINIPLLSGWLARRQMSYEGGFNGRCNKLVDGCYSFWQGSGSTIVQYWEQCLLLSVQQNGTNNNNSSNNNTENNMNVTYDPWMIQYHNNMQQQQQQKREQQQQPKEDTETKQSSSIKYEDEIVSSLFDIGMLQRYILLCAQDTNGGLRDKPSKGRDFYHTCYNLSGLSVSQNQINYSYNIHESMTQPLKMTTNDDNTIIDGLNTISSPSSSSSLFIPTIEFGHSKFSVVNPTHPCYNVQLDKVAFVQNYFQNHSNI